MEMNALVILIFLICSGRASTQILGKIKAKCLEELIISNQELQIMKKSAKPDLKLKCFFSCILEKNKLIADDKIIPGAFKKRVGPQISARKVVQVESVCHSRIFKTKVMGKCDFGHTMYKCYNLLIRDDLLKWWKKIKGNKYPN